MWLQNFKHTYKTFLRYDLSLKAFHGEQKSADLPAAEKWLKDDLPSFLKTYPPKDIYNGDEFALCFRGMPNRSFFPMVVALEA